ncbi:MAG: class I SAM-dependent methyltransferase [Patescibacteria group bacterium]|nr:class I SAM-dependent methyltransferase [Patescibacteria group bacterium]
MVWSSGSLESVRCDACGQWECSPLYVRRDGLTLVRCQGCGLAYINPRPRGDEVRLLYDANYFTEAGAASGIGASMEYLNPFMAEQRRFHARVLADLLARHMRLRGSRILEVGCASGDLTYQLARRGAHVVGLDVSPEIIHIAQGRFPGMDFRAGEIDSAELAPGAFDAVCAVMVLEHVLAPQRFLQRIRELLSPRGYGLVVVPNLAAGERVGLDRWQGIQEGFEHLHYFTPESLAALGRRAGLSTVQWYTNGGSGEVASARPSGQRQRMQQFLHHFGLLNMVRWLRWTLRSSSLSYTPAGNGSVLGMVWQSPSSRESGVRRRPSFSRSSPALCGK